MTIKTMGRGLAAVGLALALLLAGCQRQEAKLVTGSVNSTRILQYDPEYQALAQEYFRERADLVRDLGSVLRTEGGVIRDQETYDRLRKAEAELSARWLKRTREFTQVRMDRIRAAAEKLSKEKGLDLVILDSPEFATVEYGALDITSDVLGEMPGMAGGTGAVTATPAGEAK